MSINNKLPLVAIRPSWGFSEVRRGRCAEDELINSRKSVICQQGLPPPAPPVAFRSLPPSARFRLMEHNPTPPVSLSSPARTRLASRPHLLSHG